MAKVINSNQTKLINLEVTYSARKKNVEVGGLLGWLGYKFDMNSLTNMKVLDDENMMGTSATGKMAGAGIGALAFGGAGAVVGTLIGGGNKKITSKKIALEFGKDWLIIQFEDSLLDTVIMNGILMDCKVEQASPFAN
jgi:hypothetical protein